MVTKQSWTSSRNEEDCFSSAKLTLYFLTKNAVTRRNSASAKFFPTQLNRPILSSDFRLSILPSKAFTCTRRREYSLDLNQIWTLAPSFRNERRSLLEAVVTFYNVSSRESMYSQVNLTFEYGIPRSNNSNFSRNEPSAYCCTFFRCHPVICRGHCGV